MSSRLPLFYKSVRPLNASVHAGYSIEPMNGYAFATETNSVYLSSVEFSKAAKEYPIVFAGDADGLFPVALLGYREKENLFLKEDGGWDGEYVPAYVRRYPFVPASIEGNGRLSVCVDESYAGLNKEGKGNPLFDADGEPTEYTNTVTRFLSGFQAEYDKTQRLCSVLPELGLLEDCQVKIELPNKNIYLLKGMKVVSRERLAELRPEEMTEMLTHGLLEMVYYHLFSLDRIEELVKRVR